MSASFFSPKWVTHARVNALMTTRQGGVSEAPFDSFNLGVYVGDPAAETNRAQLRHAAQLPAEPRWLHQVHSTRCVAARDLATEAEADSSWTDESGVVLVALAADCLPVLFASRDGSCVAAAHAGWRGLAAGVLENTVSSMPTDPGNLVAWLGPAIGPTAFEVGEEVRAAFVDQHGDDAQHFARGAQANKWLADIFALARARLLRAGLASVSGGGVCTVHTPERYFSHRRDKGASGRMAAMIWLN
ncbi:MAG: peptidoglycan editing factor PgeF [Pseudomonadota bacterium]